MIIINAHPLVCRQITFFLSPSSDINLQPSDFSLHSTQNLIPESGIRFAHKGISSLVSTDHADSYVTYPSYDIFCNYVEPYIFKKSIERLAPFRNNLYLCTK